MSVSKKKFRDEITYWSAKLNVTPTRITIRKMTRKWGSCSTKGWVSFNLELLEKPKSFRQFVIAHELLHLKIPNHGKLFKSMMSTYIPEWEKIRP